MAQLPLSAQQSSHCSPMQAKQRNMEELTPGQANQMARNERAIEQAQVSSHVSALCCCSMLWANYALLPWQVQLCCMLVPAFCADFADCPLQESG